MRLAFLPLVLAAGLAAPAPAQQPGVAVPNAQPEEVPVNQIIVYGNDACPVSSDEETVVCVRLPEDDRFRIPSNLRENPNGPGNQSWANRALELSYVGRTGTESCSTSGPGGFTGCQQQIINQARAERRAVDPINWARLVEEARQARLRRIDADAAAEEAADQNRPD
jgi:hypothetical protein